MTEEEYEKDKLLPYWAEQWPASFALFHFLAERIASAFPPSPLVCELGSGIGTVCSLAASRGFCYVATDISFDACRFSRYNILLHSSAARVVSMDWRCGCFKPVFDCVVASDVTYEERWLDPVLDFIDRSLKAGGIAYVADPCRQWWDLFKKNASRAGFAYTTAWIERVNDGKTTVEILRLWRKRDPVPVMNAGDRQA